MKNFIYRFKYKYADKLRLKKPVDVLLELSSYCNQKCKYCYHAGDSLPFNRNHMSFNTAKAIIDSAASIGVHSMKFNWRGEATLNPSFSEIITYAWYKSKGMTLMDRITNSNFLFPEKDRKKILKSLCLQTKVKVSFDSFIPEVFAAQRGSVEDHAKIFNNINSFYHHPNRTDTKLVIQAVRTKLNADEDIEGRVKSIWPDAEVSIRDMVDGRVDNDNNLSTKKRDKSSRKPCLQAFARIIFNHRGSAYPCCPDIESKLYLGNIHEQSIPEIWNSAQYKTLRKNLQLGSQFDFDPCRTCSSFESYKGYKHGWES